MDKLNCEVIQDLLPLYIDDVCSEASKYLIEEHLVECDQCSERVSELHKDDIAIQLQTDQHETYKKLAAKLKLRKVCLIFICIISTFIVLTTVEKIYHNLSWGSDVVIGYDKVHIADVCRLSDGRIAFQTIVDDGYRVNGASSVTYPYPMISLMRGKIKLKNADDKDWIERFTLNDCYWVFHSEWGKISYVDQDGSEMIIWQQGDDIPMASKEINERLINREDGIIKQY